MPQSCHRIDLIFQKYERSTPGSHSDTDPPRLRIHFRTLRKITASISSQPTHPPAIRINKVLRNSELRPTKQICSTPHPPRSSQASSIKKPHSLLQRPIVIRRRSNRRQLQINVASKNMHPRDRHDRSQKLSRSLVISREIVLVQNSTPTPQVTYAERIIEEVPSPYSRLQGLGKEGPLHKFSGMFFRQFRCVPSNPASQVARTPFPPSKSEATSIIQSNGDEVVGLPGPTALGDDSQQLGTLEGQPTCLATLEPL